MSVKLQVKNDKRIRIFAMKPGQIGVIVKCMSGNYMGCIVQRSNNHLFAIGSHYCWDHYFDKDSYDNDNDMVVLLETGDILVVNQ